MSHNANGEVWEILTDMVKRFREGTLKPSEVSKMGALLRLFQQAADVERIMSDVQLSQVQAMRVFSGKRPVAELLSGEAET